jgi:hypothetical protein
LGENARVYLKSRSAGGFTGRFTSTAPIQKLATVGTYSSAAIVNGTPAIASPASPRSLRVRLRVRADATTVRASATPRILEVTRYFRLRNAAP